MEVSVGAAWIVCVAEVCCTILVIYFANWFFH